MGNESKHIERSVYIGGNADNNTIVVGDNNQTHVQKITLPNAADVDMKATLDALRQALAGLDSPDIKKINNALSDAEDELAKPEPDKDEIGTALDRALGYAEKTQDFVSAIDKLVPYVKNSAAWLGKNWHKLLGFVSLSV